MVERKTKIHPLKIVFLGTRGEIFGHATINQQLIWCEKQTVPRMLITHCGSAIVSHHKKAEAIIAALAREHSLEARIVTDGLTLKFNKI